MFLQTATEGLSNKTKALLSATTVVNVSAAAAPISGQVLTATSPTAATWQTPTTGTVTTVSVVSANGISGSVANPTTTPAITLSLGAITPSSVNGLTLSALATGFSIAGGTTPKTLTMSNTLTFTGTDGSSVNFGTGGTVLYANQSITLSGDVTGSGSTAITTTVAKIAGTTVSGTTGSTNVVFSNSPTLVTPTLGVATATSINGLSLTALATGFSIAGGTTSKTLTVSNTLTLTGTDSSSINFGTGGNVVYDNVTTLSSLASIGTITTGVWNGTAVDVAHGGTGDTSLTAYAVLCGGTTSTGAVQSIASVGTSGQLLTSNGAGALPSFKDLPSAPKLTTSALINSQVNVSSRGSSYTDTTGGTYGEATGQTRLTASGSQRNISCRISWHVSAGTGSRQIFNVTDSTALGSVDTTTSTTEVTGALTSSFASTNNGDLITIQLKNSGAGNTVTIDDGGMMETDSVPSSITATGSGGLTGINYTGGYPSSVSVALLRCLSTATATIQLQQNAQSASNELVTSSNIGATFGTSQANSVFTRTPTLKMWNGTLAFNTSALSASGYLLGISLQLSADSL